MAKTESERAALWKEIGDLMVECTDERSRVEWLAPALDKPEREILDALRYGEANCEVRSFPNGFWRLI